MKREPELTFLRLVPGDTFVHRLWAGTKLVVAAGLAIMVSFSPTWAMIGIAASVVVLGLLVARIPLGAFPRLPGWFFLFLGIGASLNLLSGAEPTVDIGSLSLSLGGLSDWARFTAVAVVLITSGALVGWTTPLADVAPALSTLFRPLRWLRLPVDEWVVAIALAIRCLPLMIDEIRMLAAARRLRKHENPEPTHASLQDLLVEAQDIMATAMVLSIRRARDLSDAMQARGGLGGAVSATRVAVRVGDVAVMVAITALCVVTLAVLHL